MHTRSLMLVVAMLALIATVNLVAQQKQAKPQSGSTNMNSHQIRRVVTGKDSSGKAVVLMDSAAPNVVASKERGTVSTLLWVTDSTPASVAGKADAADRKIGVPPPPNGSVFRIIEFPPEKEVKSSYDELVQALRKQGLAPEGPSRDHPPHPGMHRTRTIDYALILSGEIDMVMDNSEVHLKAGDVVVQRATNHAWANRSDKPCKVAFILIDAKD